MLGYISGKFLACDEGSILVDVNGVGYQITVFEKVSNSLKPNDPITLFLHTHLRENALELFGFTSTWEKKVFLTLNSVSGIGPKTALSILGGVDPEILLSSLVRHDTRALVQIPGIGKKTAERLVVELADKAKKLLAERPKDLASFCGADQPANTTRSPSDLWSEAIEALQQLGYRPHEASDALKRVYTDNASSLPSLLKAALQQIAKTRSISA